MKYKDYYATLGVERGAGDDDIKRAYRKLARKYHPDVSKEGDAEERFKEVAEAYATLKDPEKRAAYDQLGRHAQGEDFRPPPDWWQHFSTGQPGQAGGGGPRFEFEDVDLADLFENLRAGRAGAAGTRSARVDVPMPGADFELAVEVTLDQSFHGTELQLDLALPEYADDGRLRREPRTVNVRVPRGVTDGQRLRVPGKGGRGSRGGRNGDLYLDIALRPHPLYRVDGHDLYVDLPVAPWEAVLGATVQVPTPGGGVNLKVPAGTRAGQHLRLTGRGLPKPRTGAGDFYAIVQIVIPPRVSAEERTLFGKLAAESKFDPRQHFRMEHAK